MIKTYTLKVETDSRGENSETVAMLVKKCEQHVKEACDIQMKDAQIRLVSLELQP